MGSKKYFYLIGEFCIEERSLEMKRIIVMVLKNIIFVPYYWIMLNWYAAHVDKYTEEQRYANVEKN